MELHGKIPLEIIETVNRECDLATLVADRLELKRVGRDLFGLCPFHNENTPSFSVTPQKNLYYCHGCGAAGGPIDWVMKTEGLLFPAAVRRLAGQLGVEIPTCGPQKKPVVKTAPQPRPAKHSEKRTRVGRRDIAAVENLTWQSMAAAFVEGAHLALMDNEAALLRLMETRKLTLKTIKQHLLGMHKPQHPGHEYRHRSAWGLPEEIKENGKPRKLWTPAGMVIPHLDDRYQVRRVRIRRREGAPKYYVLPGSSMAAMITGAADRGARQAVVVVESELDAILIGQEAGDICAAIALGSNSAGLDPAAADLVARATVLLVALDNDGPGRKSSEAWVQTYPTKAVIHPVPSGKDPGEYILTPGADLRSWIVSGLPRTWRMGLSFWVPEKGGGENNFSLAGMAGLDGLEELGRLLSESRGAVLARPERVRLDVPDWWQAKNGKQSRRLSELVFMNEALQAYLVRHPRDVINAGNIMEGYNGNSKFT